MRSKEYDNMFYVCWLIERFFRTINLPHKYIVEGMTLENLQHYYNMADILHCENPDKIIGELAEELNLPRPPLYSQLVGEEKKPPFSKIAKSYARVIDAVHANDYVNGLYAFFSSFLPPLLSDYGNNLYWANKEYLVACYRADKLL